MPPDAPWWERLLSTSAWRVIDEVVDPIVTLLTLGLLLWSIVAMARVLRRLRNGHDAKRQGR